MKVNEKLRLLRETHHLSQEDMANKLSMSTKGYAKIERGETRSNLPRLEQISEIFDMDLFELLAYGEDERIINLNRSVFNNSENSLNHAFISLDSGDLQKELEKYHLMLQHKDEIIANKNEIIENQKKEIELLREMNLLLKQEK